MYSLIDMLTYKRPEGTFTQMEFCERFLEPQFGLPDRYGNYILTIGDKPRLCFTAHHDTVHKSEGMQKLLVIKDVVSVADPLVSNCLGADCTTGIYVILNMIEAGVEGTYVIHAGEEIGCIGSSALVKDDPDWLKHTDAVISFDRYGDKSVITHQSGYRTASDEFAASFSAAVGMPQLIADSGGSYTDSNEYMGVVSECTNISVGYYGQHTKSETQDLVYLDKLIDGLVSADWSKLVIARDPNEVEDLYFGNLKDGWGWTSPTDKEVDNIEDFIRLYPREVAELLLEYGFNVDAMADEMQFYTNDYASNYASRRFKY